MSKSQIKHLIFWIDKIKKQQLSYTTSFTNKGAQVHNRAVIAKKEVNFHYSKTIPVYIDVS